VINYEPRNGFAPFYKRNLRLISNRNGPGEEASLTQLFGAAASVLRTCCGPLPVTGIGLPARVDVNDALFSLHNPEAARTLA
jgi:hypothetical protein